MEVKHDKFGKYGEMSLRSGYKSEEIVQILIDNGFYVSCDGICGVDAQYLIFKQKVNQNSINK